MAVAFESVSSTFSDSTALSVTVNAPASVASGDVLIAVLTTRRNVNNDTHANDVGGFTLLYQRNHSAGSSIGYTSVWVKESAGSEPASYDFSWNGSSARCSISVARFSGSDGVDVSAVDSGDSSTATCPTVTTTVDDALVLRIIGAFDADIDPFTGLTGYWDHGGQAINAGAGGVQSSAGASGTLDVTLSATRDYAAFTVALEPTAAAGTPSGSGSVSAVAVVTGEGNANLSGSGSIDAVAGLAGAGKSNQNGSGAIDAVCDITGVGATNRYGSGSIDAIGGLTGEGSAPDVGASSGSGSVVVVGGLTGEGSATKAGTGQVESVATLSGAGSAPSVGPSSGSGSIDAIGALTGAGTREATGSGSIDAIAQINGVGSNGTGSFIFQYYNYLGV